jgi:sedoheptulokinase
MKLMKKKKKHYIIEKIEYFPYFGEKYLAVAASLNGGNTLATFVKSLQQWTLELGFSVPQCMHYHLLLVYM